MNTKVLVKLGKNIKRFRIDAGLTQEELANKICAHQTYIGKLELGMINPSTKRLFELSRALGITIPDLFDFDKK